MRQKKKITHVISADPIYDNTQVAKFINQLMRRGKKRSEEHTSELQSR